MRRAIPAPKVKLLFKDIEHLLRLAAVMLIAVVAFVVLRAAVVPKSFGQYGHYRGDAIAEVAARPVGHAGHEVCEAGMPDFTVRFAMAHKPGTLTIPLPSSRPCPIPP